MVKPTTGNPRSTRIAATAELSTPPLIATAVMGRELGFDSLTIQSL
jgi:hypothetical protein